MDKRDLIPAFILIALLMAWFVFQPKPTPPAPTPVISTDTAAASPTGDTRAVTVRPVDASDSQAAAVPPIDPGAATAAAELAAGLLPGYRGLGPAAPVQIVNGDISTWVVDVEAGGIASVTLAQYEADRREDGHMILGHPDHPMLRVSNGAGFQLSHGRVLYNAQDPAFAAAPVPPGQPTLQIGHQIVGTQVELIQSWYLEDGERYELMYAVTFLNHGDTPVRFDRLAMNAGTMRPTDAPKGFMGSAGMDQRADVLTMDKKNPKTRDLGKLLKWDKKGENPYADHDIQWVSVQNKYFGVIVDGDTIPFTGFAWETFPYTDPAARQNDVILTGKLYFPLIDLGARGSQTINSEIHIGPKKWSLLKDERHNKKAVMNFDLFWFWHFKPMEMISRALFGLIEFLNAHTGNYGWDIVLTTVLLSILFAYPRHLSSLLSRRMAKLQPEMAKLKEQYGNDPQKLNMKMMELYKIHKVNPAAGCLPVLFQIPVFFAFFNVLRSAVELRQASFLWVSDLAMPDTLFSIGPLPINPLALAMGAFMILNQKLMPTTADSSQQRIMTIMSLGFVFIGYTMPAGLTLYWTVNSICSLVQYQVSRRVLDREVEADEAAIAAQGTKKS